MVTIEAEYVQCERTQQNCRKKLNKMETTNLPNKSNSTDVEF